MKLMIAIIISLTTFQNDEIIQENKGNVTERYNLAN